MKEIQYESLPNDLQEMLWDLVDAGFVGMEITENDVRYVEFKVQTAADTEWGNGHVPLAVYLVKNKLANKGETVKIVGI